MPTEHEPPSLDGHKDLEAQARAEAIRLAAAKDNPFAALKLFERVLADQQQDLVAQRQELVAQRAQLAADRAAFSVACAAERQRILDERTAYLAATQKAVENVHGQLTATTALSARVAKDMEEAQPRESVLTTGVTMLITEGSKLLSKAMDKTDQRQLGAGEVELKGIEEMPWVAVRQIVGINNQLAALMVKNSKDGDNGVPWVIEQVKRHGFEGGLADMDSMTLGMILKVVSEAGPQ